MKKSIIISLAFVLTYLNGISQEFNYNSGQVPTTMEIYNYVTKGYAVQVASGLDMKKGYFLFEKLTRSVSFTDVSRSATVAALVTEGNNKVCAWMVVYRKDGADAKIFCIPTQASDESVWNKSFADLRDSEFGTEAYLAYTYTLYSLIGQLTNDYDNICFKSNTLITMSDGSQKEISSLQSGDKVLTYNGCDKSASSSEISKVIIHDEKKYSITRLTLVDENVLFASITSNLSLPTKYLEGTANHPVISDKGIKRIGDIQVNDKLIQYDNSTNSFKEWTISQIESNYTKVDKVYNLRLKSDYSYFANGFAVMMK